MTTTLHPSEPIATTTDAQPRAVPWASAVNWELIAYAVIFVLAIVTRFYDLESRAMSHDESLHTRFSYNLYADGVFEHTPLMHGPILFHMTALMYSLFGASDASARYYAAFLGVGLVLSPWLFRRWLGRLGAVFGAVLLLISPLMMYYNRYIREDTPALFFSVMTVWGIAMYLAGPADQRRKFHWLLVTTVGMIGNLGTKETAFIYILIFGVFLAGYWLVRLAQHTWGVPGRTIFYTGVLGALLGGVAALGMYHVLTINPPELAFAAPVEGVAATTNARAFIVWTTAITVATLVTILGTMTAAFWGSKRWPHWTFVTALVLFVVFVASVFVALEERTRPRGNAATVEQSTSPGTRFGDITITNGATSEVVNVLPYAFTYALAAAGIGFMLFLQTRGFWALQRREFPEFDLIIVIASLILPWATPFVTFLSGIDPVAYTSYATRTMTLVALVPFVAVAVVAGVLWDWRRWLVCHAVFYAIFLFFFTTMLTNLNGVVTGVIGSLGYWLNQQDVHRGGQPTYYYTLVVLPFYEFIVIAGSVCATITGSWLFWRYRRTRMEAEAVAEADARAQAESAASAEGAEDVVVDLSAAPAPAKAKRHTDALDVMPFLPFLGWWAVANLIAYTLAGEKMPWLGVHMSLPMALLSGWWLGRVLQRVDLQRFANLGWLHLLLMPLGLVLALRVLAPFVYGQSILGDTTRETLSRTGTWLALLAVVCLVLLAVSYLVDRTGWRFTRQMFAASVFGLLSFATVRSALMASFQNADLAQEFLVYAHAAPGVKNVLGQLEELSLRTTDGMNLSLIYDNEVSWPMSWYLRDFPNARFVGSSPNAQQVDQAVAAVIGEANRTRIEPLLEERFFRTPYIRMWWPMEEYKRLNPQRLGNVFSATPEGAAIRWGIYNIWWNRNYDPYAQATGLTLTQSQWPLVDRMHLYVRRDVAAQVWSLGAGENETLTTALSAVDDSNVCNTNWQPLMAVAAYGAPSIDLVAPQDVEVLPDGTLMVAEEYNYRVSFISPDGQLLNTIGRQGRVRTDDGTFLGHEATGGLFERPAGVAVGPDGTFYVADTWNYRVQAFAPDGTFLRAWGSALQLGGEAPREPLDGLWGPRDVEVDAQGRVYVADTGNKRIRVYDSTGQWLLDMGGVGSGNGQLNEPVGLAIHPDGRVFVADTWNRRISVFAPDGTPVTTFRVRGWFNDLGNRPYMALDAARDLLYVGDHDGGRVMVFNLNGDCVGAFGQTAPSDGTLLGNHFRVVGGMALGAAGELYVADPGVGRVLVFPPFSPADDSLGNDSISVPLSLDAATDEDASASEDVSVDALGLDALLMPTEETTPALSAPQTE